jgi:hypothetical protein
MVTICISALNASLHSSADSGNHGGTAFFEWAPLLYTRLLQVQLGALADNVDGAGSRRMQQLEVARGELAALSRFAMPNGARTPEQRSTIATALQNYGLCRRSGRYHHASRGQHPQIPPAVSQPTATLHMHFHLVNHAGTSLQDLIRHGTCSAEPESCGMNWVEYRDKRPNELTATSTNVQPIGPSCCSHSCELCAKLNSQEGGTKCIYHKQMGASCDRTGDVPVDIVMVEGRLSRILDPSLADAQIVWSAIARHPLPFALTNGIAELQQGAESFLAGWLGDVLVLGRPFRGVDPCSELPPFRGAAVDAYKAGKSHGRLSTAVAQCMNAKRHASGSASATVSDSIIDAVSGSVSVAPTATSLGLTDLKQAKNRARSVAMHLLLETIDESATVFCVRLGWPACTLKASTLAQLQRERQAWLCNRSTYSSTTACIKGLDDTHALSIRHPECGFSNDTRMHRSLLAADATTTSFTFVHPPKHQDIAGLMRYYGYGLREFAQLADAAQLSIELYYFIRELQRVDHVEIGLAPPPTWLLPEAVMQALLSV